MSATTATPSEICTTFLTPGIFIASSAPLKLIGLPPITGHWAKAAYSMPGSLTSMPNSALPSTFDGVSRRFTGLPITLNAPGAFSCGDFGGCSFEAASASSPYEARWPAGPRT